MAEICDNPKCKYHIRLPPFRKNVGVIDVLDGKEIIQVDRWAYAMKDRTLKFLCNTCHEAVQTVRGKID